MANLVLLDSNKHRNLRVITSRGAEYGENVHLVPVIADELSGLVLDYPVCLLKDEETGQFGLHALLGFDPGENLYLSGDKWDATYVPLHVKRQPFMVGIAANQGEEATSENAVITIDLDSKRVQQSEGEALFTEVGSRTAYLTAIDSLLAELMNGIKTTEAYVAAIAELDLIESAQVNITFANGDQRTYDGLYTINADKLNELSGEALEELNRKGFLQASYLLLASMGQLQKLIARKNATATGTA